MDHNSVYLTYMMLLVRKKKVLAWRSKHRNNCFKIVWETRTSKIHGNPYVIYLGPKEVSHNYMAALWNWELYPERTPRT